MQMIEVSKLKPHPRNKEFFDDISGDKWEDFKKSIIRRGIVEPVVVTADLTIVSGHQRWRAAKELKILEVPCNITYYPERDEKLNINKNDMILEDLISTNILQRGIGNCNAMKMAKCIIELERIYGVRQGSAGQSHTDNLNGKTQSDLAKQLNISQQQLQDYKKLTTLIPELQSMVEHDALKSTTAYKIWAKLSSDEQHDFFNQIGIENIKKLTQKQTINEINKIKREKQQIEDKNKQLELSFNELSKKYDKLSQTKIINKSTEDINDINKIGTNASNTIETLKSEKRDLELKIVNLVDKLKGEKVVYKDNPELIAQIDSLKNQLKDKDQEINKNKEIKNKLNEQQKIISKFTGENTNLNIIASTSENSLKMMKFLEEMSKYDYIAETFNEIPIASRKEWMRGVNGIYKWAKHILEVVDIENDTSCINKNNEPIDVTYSN